VENYVPGGIATITVCLPVDSCHLLVRFAFPFAQLSLYHLNQTFFYFSPKIPPKCRDDQQPVFKGCNQFLNFKVAYSSTGSNLSFRR